MTLLLTPWHRRGVVTSKLPLSQIELTGWRLGIRQAAMVTLAMAALITGMAAPLAVRDAPLGLLVAPAALALAWAGMKGIDRRYPRGILLGLLGLLGSPVALVLLVITLCCHGGRSDALPVALIGALTLCPLGLLLAVIEPVVHRLERGRLRRDVDPVFPTARVVER